jgi:hypothetical protein
MVAKKLRSSDISGKKPVQKQVLQVPNTFSGISFHPTGQQFHVSGGVDDNVHTFTFSGGAWAETGAPIFSKITWFCDSGHRTAVRLAIYKLAASF